MTKQNPREIKGYRKCKNCHGEMFIQDNPHPKITHMKYAAFCPDCKSYFDCNKAN